MLVLDGLSFQGHHPHFQMGNYWGDVVNVLMAQSKVSAEQELALGPMQSHCKILSLVL